MLLADFLKFPVVCHTVVFWLFQLHQFVQFSHYFFMQLIAVDACVYADKKIQLCQEFFQFIMKCACVGVGSYQLRKHWLDWIMFCYQWEHTILYAILMICHRTVLFICSRSPKVGWST